MRIVGAGSDGGGTASSTGTASAKGGARVRRGLPELTMLPDRKHPAAIFMGVSSDSKKALLLVSSDVRAVFGDARCLVGSRSCQLLALEPGLPETFVYGCPRPDLPDRAAEDPPGAQPPPPPRLARRLTPAPPAYVGPTDRV